MEEAASRTARLQALRAAKERRAQSNADAVSAIESPASDAASAPKVIFRNYQPVDKSLQETARLPRAGVVKAALPSKVADEDGVINVIAKKANWDLKRDIQPKLQKLERRTEVLLHAPSCVAFCCCSTRPHALRSAAAPRALMRYVLLLLHAPSCVAFC
jgi:coiled-coil domain-containing protein 12